MKRNDAVQVYDIPAYNKIFPFMLKRRCDSLVYHSYKLDVTETVKYIREFNSKKPEKRLKFFYVFCAALIRTFVLRPELNRFIASNRYWQRKELSMNFCVKENFTDDSPETSTPIKFEPDMVLSEYVEVIDKYITESRNTKSSNNTDNTISLLMHVPYFLINAAVKFMGFLERRFGYAAKWLREADGLHTSVFVSNLGSIGISGGGAHHHLYEWGTTSVFVTIGGMERKREVDKEGNIVKSGEVVEIGATIDERISSGFYFVKSMMVLQDLLSHPEKLEVRPELPPPTLTKKQWKAKLREQKRAAIAALKQEKKVILQNQ